MHRFLKITYFEQVTDHDVCRKNQTAIGQYDEILTMVKIRKPHLKFFGLNRNDPTGQSERNKKRQKEENIKDNEK